jgi:hypothetical protein
MIAAETALAHPSARCIAVIKQADAEAEQQQPAMAWFPKPLGCEQIWQQYAARWIQRLYSQQFSSNATASKRQQQQLHG